MSSEIPAAYEQATIHGERLKKATINKLLTTNLNLPAVFVKNIDDLGIDWDIPRGSGEINSIAPSLANSLRYAYLVTDGGIPPAGSVTTIEECTSAIKGVLNDSNKFDVFRQNIWRHPTSYLPLRGFPLQYIFRQQFGFQEFDAVDIGCGLNNMLSYLNSSYYLHDISYPRMKRNFDINEPLYPHLVNIRQGIGIDKQEPNTEMIMWALSSAWGNNLTQVEKMVDSITKNKEKYPIITGDVIDMKNVSMIKETVEAKTNTTGVHAVVTSFMRYQLDQDPQTQDSLKRFILTLLRSEGIWIDIGEEMKGNHDGLFSVKIYKKDGRTFGSPQTPFKIKMDGRISEVDSSYFQAYY